MPAWLTLMIIVLVAIALFADHRRNVDDLPHAAGREKLPSPASDSLIRPNVRDPNGHPASVPRPLTARRAARGVRKQR